MPRHTPRLTALQSERARALWPTHSYRQIADIFFVETADIISIARVQGWPLKGVMKRIAAGVPSLTEKQEAIARRLWVRRSYSQIGARFGVSRDVIAGLAHRRNWPKKTILLRIQAGEPALTPRQEQGALQMWPTKSYTEIGARYSVSRNVIAGLSVRRSWPLKRDLLAA